MLSAVHTMSNIQLLASCGREESRDGAAMLIYFVDVASRVAFSNY